MKNKKLILIVLVSLFSSCTAQTSNNVYQSFEKDYPESRYLFAVGEGDTRKEAEKNAIAKISLIFESKINVNNTLNENYFEFSDDKSSSFMHESKTTKKINVTSNQKIMNIKYGKHGVDEVGNNFVIAYINRSETASIYEEKIANNNSLILALKNAADSSNIVIFKYAALNRASGLMNKNIVLMKQLSIISPYNPDFSSKISNYESIYLEKGKVANSIKFTFPNKSNEDVLNTLKSLLVSKGFKVGENGKFLVSSTMKFTKVDLNRKEIFYNWFMNVEVMNNKHEIIFNFEKSGRDGGITESAVYSRAKYSAKNALRQQFIFGFEEYLNSLLGE